MKFWPLVAIWEPLDRKVQICAEDGEVLRILPELATDRADAETIIRLHGYKPDANASWKELAGPFGQEFGPISLEEE